MKDQKLIVVLLVVIILLLLVVGLMLYASSIREESYLAIQDGTIHQGDSLVVVLTDPMGGPISGAEVNIEVTAGDKIISNEKVKTDSEGKAKLNLEKEGTYSVKCSFGGDDEFAGSSVADEIKVEQATTEVISEEKTSTHTSKYASDGSIYPEYGPEVDSQGITREYAIAHNMHYIEMTVDGDRPGEYVTVGGYTAYDPAAGCYHT